MKQAAKEIMNLPMKQGETTPLESMQDVSGSNVTLEEAIIIKQAQQALTGSTDAAAFLQAAIGEEEEQESDEGRAIIEAAAKGDSLSMYKAMRADLVKRIACTSSDRVASLYQTLIGINDRIESMEQAEKNKKGENPLNVILFNSAKKRANGKARA